eukprot:4939505-Pyramimonas_sp.AAC.1
MGCLTRRGVASECDGTARQQANRSKSVFDAARVHAGIENCRRRSLAHKSGARTAVPCKRRVGMA